MFDGVLQDDLSQFFFGAKVKILDEKSNEEERKSEKLPRACQTPIKTLTHESSCLEGKEIKIKVYKSGNLKCLRCGSYNLARIPN